MLDQLIRTLAAEAAGENQVSLSISGASGGDPDARSEIGIGATEHGKQLMALGYTVDQVVHDYGDLCQAITDLAIERNDAFTVESYRTLNRCLDNAIADAVVQFASQRDAFVVQGPSAAENYRLGVLAHELRNYLGVAMLAFQAIESGKLSSGGATASMLGRSLRQLDGLIGKTLADVRSTNAPLVPSQAFSLADFVGDAAVIATLFAADTGCVLSVPDVDPGLMISGNRELLAAALTNLLQNAFKFTAPQSTVTLLAFASQGRALIEVHDHCGGLAPGAVETMFKPFSQVTDDRRGMGLGLSIASQTVIAAHGTLTVQDVSGSGCVFTINLPLHTA